MLDEVRRISRWMVFGLGDEVARNLLSPLSGGRRKYKTKREVQGTAIVTGASRGIGHATARKLAIERGMNVVVCGRNLSQIEAVASEIRSEGGACRAAVVDLTSSSSASRGAVNCLKAVSDERIRLVVNNAGTMGGSRRQTMTTNLVAQLIFTLTLLPALAPDAIITNVGSSSHLRSAAMLRPGLLQDETTDRSLGAYAESKLGLMHCSRLLTAAGISCVDCHPGLVWTSMLSSRFPTAVASFLEKTPILRRRFFRDPDLAAETIITAGLDAFPPITRQLYVVDSKFISKGLRLAPESSQPSAIAHTWHRLLRPSIDTFLASEADQDADSISDSRQDFFAARSIIANGRDRIDLACNLAFHSSPSPTVVLPSSKSPSLTSSSPELPSPATTTEKSRTTRSSSLMVEEDSANLKPTTNSIGRTL